MAGDGETSTLTGPGLSPKQRNQVEAMIGSLGYQELADRQYGVVPTFLGKMNSPDKLSNADLGIIFNAVKGKLTIPGWELRVDNKRQGFYLVKFDPKTKKPVLEHPVQVSYGATDIGSLIMYRPKNTDQIAVQNTNGTRSFLDTSAIEAHLAPVPYYHINNDKKSKNEPRLDRTKADLYIATLQETIEKFAIAGLSSSDSFRVGPAYDTTDGYLPHALVLGDKRLSPAIENIVGISSERVYEHNIVEYNTPRINPQQFVQAINTRVATLRKLSGQVNPNDIPPPRTARGG